MAALQNKRNILLLAVFVLLCFCSIQARARTLKEVVSNQNPNRGDHASTTVQNKEANHHDDAKFKPEEHDQEVNAGTEVFSMDYTPASRKPPIHN